MKTNKFPTRADLAFWQSRHTPSWARLIPKSKVDTWGGATIFGNDLDLVVNSHAGITKSAGEVAASNLLAILASRRGRGEGGTAMGLAALAANPNCAIDPKKRAAFARKWLRRIGEES